MLLLASYDLIPKCIRKISTPAQAVQSQTWVRRHQGWSLSSGNIPVSAFVGKANRVWKSVYLITLTLLFGAGQVMAPFPSGWHTKLYASQRH
uniref:Uncharacterized protein n=1 Tax=Arundo donax TaxID=35708 RepID=A0A0A9BY26_ARUDO